MNPKNSRNFDCVVVGAGIVGAACALALARDGHRTAIIDAKPASGATAAGMGHLVVMDDSDAQFALTSYSRRLWNDFAERLPASCEFENRGTMWVAADADEFKEVERKAKFYAARGVETEILDEKQLRRHEPNLREGLAGGLRVPGDSVVYQPRAAAAFLDESIAAGAKLIGESGVAAVESGAVVLKDGTNISCGAIIVAAGAATVGLLPGFEIVSKKGHLVITERYPGFIRHQIIELGYLKSAHSAGSDSVAFNVQPRLTEQVLIGSSRQPGDVTVGVDHAIVERMLRRAFEYMPRLRKLTAVRTWTGFRPATADNLPLIGRHPEMSNVFVAAGHEGLGITTSTGTAAIIADLIAGRASQIDAAPFDPARLYKR